MPSLYDQLNNGQGGEPVRPEPARGRVAFTVYVDLDDVPGEMHTTESALQAISNVLNMSMGHYHPLVSMVSVAEPKYSAPTPEFIKNLAELYGVPEDAAQAIYDRGAFSGHALGTIHGKRQALSLMGELVRVEYGKAHL